MLELKLRLKTRKGIVTEHVPKLCQVVSTCWRTQSSIAFRQMSAIVHESRVNKGEWIGMAVPHRPL